LGWPRSQRLGVGASSAAIGRTFSCSALGVDGSSTPVSEPVTIGWFDRRVPQAPRWPGYVDVPLWFVALIPAAGLWWSFRRPKERTRGFHVEAAAAASIGTAEPPRAA